MAAADKRPPINWGRLEDRPTVDTLRRLLEALPAEPLLIELRRWRAKGRDDYPVEVLWGVLVLSVAGRHLGLEAGLAELQRRADLRGLIGITSAARVPKPWNMSRFMDVLGQPLHSDSLRVVFDLMVARLGQVVPDLGATGAGAVLGLHARRPRAPRATAPQAEEPDITYSAHGLPLPAEGRQVRTDDVGRTTRLIQWFGYKCHLLVDTRHEVALAYQLTSTRADDERVRPDLIAQARASLPDRRRTRWTFDQAADTPPIGDSLTGVGEHEHRLPGHEPESPVVCDDAGTLYCYDRHSDPPMRHRMAYAGHEPARGTLKYRCPAAHEGWSCPSESVCNAGKTYGLTARAKQALDRRHFPPAEGATRAFEQTYAGYPAVDRVSARLQLFWGADDATVSGAARFHALLGTIMVVHLGFATLLA